MGYGDEFGESHPSKIQGDPSMSPRLGIDKWRSLDGGAHGLGDEHPSQRADVFAGLGQVVRVVSDRPALRVIAHSPGTTDAEGVTDVPGRVQKADGPRDAILAPILTSSGSCRCYSSSVSSVSRMTLVLFEDKEGDATELMQRQG